MTLITRPMRCGPAARASMDCPTGRIMPPPSPCRTRKAMSELADQARPHRLEPMRNTVSESMNIRLCPNRSMAHPVTGMTMASARR